MNEDKSLDEALDEFEAWGDQVSDALAGLTPAEVASYFAKVQAQLEMRLGKRLNLPVRAAPQSTVG
jgi:hypothetical protein